MTFWRGAVGLVAVATLILAACGGDDDGGDGSELRPPQNEAECLESSTVDPVTSDELETLMNTDDLGELSAPEEASIQAYLGCIRAGIEDFEPEDVDDDDDLDPSEDDGVDPTDDTSAGDDEQSDG